jgi:hypothetical protein
VALAPATALQALPQPILHPSEHVRVHDLREVVLDDRAIGHPSAIHHLVRLEVSHDGRVRQRLADEAEVPDARPPEVGLATLIQPSHYAVAADPRGRL